VELVPLLLVSLPHVPSGGTELCGSVRIDGSVDDLVIVLFVLVVVVVPELLFE